MIGHHANYLHLAGVVALLLGLYLLTKVPKALSALLKQITKDLLAVVIWRHFTGAHYHGRKPTNATWWTHGSETDRRRDLGTFMDRWEHKPRGHRLLWRWGCTFAGLALVYGLLFDRDVTVHASESLGVYGVAVSGFVIEKKIRLRIHNKLVIGPIVKSLAPVMRMSPHAVRRLVHIRPENITDEGEVGYIELPEGFSPSEELQATMTRIVNAHLPVDIELVFQMQQKPKIAVIKAGLKPPAQVSWDEMLPEMAKNTRGEVKFGKDKEKDPYGADFLGADDPHWAMLVNTKRGKSNWLAIVIAQIMHQDPESEVVVLDPKRSSLIDYLGSPFTGPGLKPLISGVMMACDPGNPGQMVDYVHHVRCTLDERSKVMSRDRYATWPIKLLVMDEMTQLQEIIDDWWREQYAEYRSLDKENREAHPLHPMPKECPFWADLRVILRTGRFVGIHVIAVGQDLRDATLGGKGTRSYFGLRGMAGYRKNQWDYFMGTSPAHRDIGGIGRWIFAQGEQDVWVQITRADPEKVYEYACHGRHGSPAMASVPVGSGVSSSSVLDPERTDGQPPGITPAEPHRVGLKAAARYLGMSPSAFEKARQRRPITGEYRIGSQPAWTDRALTDWRDSRPGNRSKDG